MAVSNSSLLQSPMKQLLSSQFQLLETMSFLVFCWESWTLQFECKDYKYFEKNIKQFIAGQYFFLERDPFWSTKKSKRYQDLTKTAWPSSLATTKITQMDYKFWSRRLWLLTYVTGRELWFRNSYSYSDRRSQEISAKESAGGSGNKLIVSTDRASNDLNHKVLHNQVGTPTLSHPGGLRPNMRRKASVWAGITNTS